LNYRPSRDAVRHLVDHYWPALVTVGPTPVCE
jgi:hypothetical protein